MTASGPRPPSSLRGVHPSVSGWAERNRFLLAFAALSTFMGVSVGLAKVATSLYSLQLGANQTLLGLIAGAQTVGILVMSLPVGFLVERVGPARLFSTGSVLAGMTYGVVPLVASTEFLLLCTALVSFFMPLRFVSLNTVFMRQLEVVGEGKAGWYRGTHLAGMFLIGPLLAPALIEWLDFAGTFWLIGTIFIVTILLAPLVFSHPAGRLRSADRHDNLTIARQLRLLAGHPQLQSLSLIGFCCHAINMFYAFFIVVIAIRELHLPPVAATGLVAVQGAVYVFALLGCGGAVSRLGARRAYLVSFAVSAAALVVLGLAHSLPVLWVGAVFLGLGSGMLEIINLMRFARLGAELGRGRVAGVNALVGPGGAIFGALVGGPAGHFFGLQTVFLAFAPLFALLWLAVPRSASAPGVAADGAPIRDAHRAAKVAAEGVAELVFLAFLLAGCGIALQPWIPPSWRYGGWWLLIACWAYGAISRLFGRRRVAAVLVMILAVGVLWGVPRLFDAGDAVKSLAGHRSAQFGPLRRLVSLHYRLGSRQAEP